MMRAELPDDTNCRPFSPLQVQSLLREVPFPWWITGSWALDMFLRTQTRPHFDIDIAIPRASQTMIHAHLFDWEFYSIRRDEKDELILQAWENNQFLEYAFPGVWAREVCERFSSSPSAAKPLAASIFVGRYSKDQPISPLVSRTWLGTGPNGYGGNSIERQEGGESCGNSLSPT